MHILQRAWIYDHKPMPYSMVGLQPTVRTARGGIGLPARYTRE